jgi:hypothetical protein
MANAFAVQPELEPGFPKTPRLWTCPITGLVVPKDPTANLKWRAELLTAADADPELQQDLFTACSQSILFYVNAFAFTLRVFEPGEDGKVQQAEHQHLPFVTWEIQDKHILRLEHGVDEGESLLTDKSRDMGATWNHLVVYSHRLLFRRDIEHLMISRKEDAVDVLDGQPKNYPFGTLADPGTLFGKIDYILSRLPEWMLPRLARKKMHLVNLDTGTRIDGESSNANAGSADRRTSIFLDEMAKMKEAEAIKRSTKDVTACRFPCSTPNGAGTTYSKWRMSGQIPVFILPWWEHPEKGKDRYIKQDELGRFKIRSPWYDAEEEVRTPKEMAIEIDMDHVGSGDTFFEATIIEQHKKMFAKPSLYRKGMTIAFTKNTPDDRIPEILRKWQIGQHIAMTVQGPWKIWTRLIKGRPDQNFTYTIGVDISKGQGASNSTINILCNETKTKIAAFADANTAPHALARLAVAACLWCGGRRKPLLIWENNGDPGFDFGNQIMLVYQYPNPYFDKQVGTTREKVGKRWGWRSSPEKKAVALGELRRAYAHAGYVNPDEKALDEALTYISYEGGGIGPASLVEESESNRKSHGDRVIADMLCVWGMRGKHKNKRREGPPPKGTIAQRFAEFKRARREAEQKNTFDFSGAR